MAFVQQPMWLKAITTVMFLFQTLSVTLYFFMFVYRYIIKKYNAQIKYMHVINTIYDHPPSHRVGCTNASRLCEHGVFSKVDGYAVFCLNHFRVLIYYVTIFAAFADLGPYLSEE